MCLAWKNKNCVHTNKWFMYVYSCSLHNWKQTNKQRKPPGVFQWVDGKSHSGPSRQRHTIKHEEDMQQLGESQKHFAEAKTPISKVCIRNADLWHLGKPQWKVQETDEWLPGMGWGSFAGSGAVAVSCWRACTAYMLAMWLAEAVHVLELRGLSAQQKAILF